MQHSRHVMSVNLILCSRRSANCCLSPQSGCPFFSIDTQLLLFHSTLYFCVCPQEQWEQRNSLLHRWCTVTKQLPTNEARQLELWGRILVRINNKWRRWSWRWKLNKVPFRGTGGGVVIFCYFSATEISPANHPQFKCSSTPKLGAPEVIFRSSCH